MAPTLRTLPPPPPGRTGWPWTEETPPAPPTLRGRPWPRISIVTPSYNQGRFIEETIRSVLLQGYPNLQYSVFDGGSTDETVAILRKYEPWLEHWASEKDRGQTHAINKGLDRADGDIAAYLNSDDYYLPGALQHAARLWHKPGFDVFVGRRVTIGDTRERELPSWFLLRRSWWLSLLPKAFALPLVITRDWAYEIPQECTFWDRTRVKDLRFDESFHYCMDGEWFARVYSGARVLHSSRATAVFRMHPETKTSQLVEIRRREVERILEMYGESMDQIAAGRTAAAVAEKRRRAEIVALAGRALRREAAVFSYVHPAYGAPSSARPVEAPHSSDRAHANKQAQP
jgi:glycosyltransferase involved in cell wall biosynthesis